MKFKFKLSYESGGSLNLLINRFFDFANRFINFLASREGVSIKPTLEVNGKPCELEMTVYFFIDQQGTEFPSDMPQSLRDAIQNRPPHLQMYREHKSGDIERHKELSAIAAHNMIQASCGKFLKGHKIVIQYLCDISSNEGEYKRGDIDSVDVEHAIRMVRNGHAIFPRLETQTPNGDQGCEER